MNRLWTALALLMFLTTPTAAGEVMFVPPDIFYLAGGGDKGAAPAEGEEADNLALCRQYGKDESRLLLDELGRSAYLALSDAVATFNGSPEAMKSRRHYRSQAMAYPSCRNNLKIKKFYQTLAEPGSPLLYAIKVKNGLDAIIWSDFRSSDVGRCLSGNRSRCPVSATVTLFDGTRVLERQIDMMFEKMNKKFTSDSLDGLSGEVVRLLTGLGTPQRSE
jgi:hypothetical protein